MKIKEYTEETFLYKNMNKILRYGKKDIFMLAATKITKELVHSMIQLQDQPCCKLTDEQILQGFKVYRGLEVNP